MRLAALLAAVLLPAAADPAVADPPATQRSVFVLGIDGMDPVILQRLMDSGQMPHFKALAAEGTFQPLGTANPPQSPVAWSTFVTGRDPGGHGIYDFIHRNPRNYTPQFSGTLPPTDDSPSYLNLFGWILPLGGEDPVNARGGTPFWDLLHDAGVDVQVYRMPGNYPVPASKALTLSGMGTPDLRGEAGKFTWFVDDQFFTGQGLKADVANLAVEDTDLDGVKDTAHSVLHGPPDFLHLKPGVLPREDQYLTVPVDFHVDPQEETVWIQAGDSECVLREGEWSDWLQVTFDPAPLGLMSMTGIVRFYAKEVRPKLTVYASPVNIDPSAPATPVATPDDAAEELCERIGFYWTQGFPEEINALKDGLFDDDDYERQIAIVHGEAERMLDEALARFGPGHCTFMYLSDIDLQCHMEWRHGDPKNPDAPQHPGYDPAVSPKHAQDIEGHYRNTDRLLGKVRAALPPDALLVVMSDHGFQAQTRQFHLNAWLRDAGYLVLEGDARTGHISPHPDPSFDAAAHPGDTAPMLDDVDWSRTRAYGLGFNSLYLNLAGREGQGSVPPAQADALMAEISQKLLAWRDPQGGRAPVRRVFRAQDIYSAERRAEGPDLIVGYDAGYGCSDASTLGEITEDLIEDNTHGFTGNHLMDPEVVPGVLLVNRKLPAAGHDLTDVTATLLREFGVAPADGMIGKPFLND
ncbi:MAG TPA: alkaline phosphatase family protein [Planctomycetota bacterium]|nr:alkaline phosphatase family protein [Planctomycetota bacterium]